MGLRSGSAKPRQARALVGGVKNSNGGPARHLFGCHFAPEPGGFPGSATEVLGRRHPGCVRGCDRRLPLPPPSEARSGFGPEGTVLYETLGVKGEREAFLRQATFELGRRWDSNSRRIDVLTRVFTFAAGAFLLQTLSLVALLGDTILH